MLHNAEDGCLSACPTGGSLESQLCVTTLEKGITILFMLCLNLTSERASEFASSSSLGIAINKSEMMKTILCFGDSNTWGYSPVDGQRYSADERWPALLTRLLPSDCKIIEQGQPGRTTFFADSSAGFVSGNGDLQLCVEKHQPDYIVLMLGTNDLKASFAQSADDISRNAAKLVREIQDVACMKKQKAATVLLVAPPVISEVGYFGQLFADGAEKSREFASYYALRAQELGCEFFDAGSVASSSPIDGIHWEAEQHRNMAEGIAVKLKEILTVVDK